MIFKNRYEKKVFLINIIIRIIVLIIVIMLSSYMEKGFIASHRDVDDWRYEAGGEYYSQNANSLFDVETFIEAFGRLKDSTGYGMKLSNLFTKSTPFWYWTVCIVMYITKTYWAVRVLNILIAGFSSIYIYRFSKKIYGEKVGRLSAMLFSILPYPVIFSCFSYKDHLVLLCTFYLLYISTKCRYNTKINISEKFIFVLLTIILMLTRSGLSIILLGLCICIAFLKKIKFKSFFSLKGLFLLLLILGSLFFFREPIIHKFNHYLSWNMNTQEAGNTISIVTITKIRELYKLPFTYIFSIIVPIAIGDIHNSWFSFVANTNIIMLPIAIGSLMFIFFKRKKDMLLFLMLIGYYSISIVMSTGIFRHYYSVLPIAYIFFSSFITKAKKSDYLFLILISIIGIFLILLYYIFIKG